MKHIKFLAVLAAMLLLVGALVGCASTSTTAPTATTAAAATAAASKAPAATTAAATAASTTTAAKATGSGDKVEVNVSAAASLTDVMGQLATAYQAIDPNVTLTFNFEASGTLQTQIEEGAPADLFISAAQKQMKALDEKGLVASATKVDLLENKVVLVVPATATDSAIKSFEDVAKEDVKVVAIGDPESVPAGQYAQEVFTSLNIWDAVSAKATLGKNVREVLAWVESADADCGVVYATDAAITEGVKVIAEAPEGSCDRIVYPAAVLTNATQPEAAQGFLDYLQTAEATALFEAAGFTMYVE